MSQERMEAVASSVTPLLEEFGFYAEVSEDEDGDPCVIVRDWQTDEPFKYSSGEPIPFDNEREIAMKIYEEYLPQRGVLVDESKDDQSAGFRLAELDAMFAEFGV